ncbi:MAG: glycosyltransferase family 4 protein [Deferribacterales bacterium]
MKRYLLVGDGSSPHLLKWVKGLSKEFDLYLFSFNPIMDELYRFVDNKKLYSAQMNLNQKGGNYSVLGGLPLLNRVMEKIDPDIVNPHYITSNGFVVVLLKKLYKYRYKIISSCWGSDILVTPQKSFLYKIITKYILKNSDMVTSDSAYMTEKIKELVNIDVLTFPFGVESLPEKREKDINLFFSNRMLKKNYNIDKIIESFAIYRMRNSDARLIIANDGYLKDELVQLVNRLSLNEVVSFVGFLSKEEQEDYYSRAMFYLSIPDSDSTSVSLLEAMSHGCIPIVSDIPANKEWVEDGVNGFFFTDGFKNIINDFNLLKEMSEKNRQIIEEKGLWKKNIDRFIKVIYEL